MNDEFEIRDGVLVKYHGCERTVVIPEGIVEIGEHAFGGNRIRNIVFPASLRRIGCGAFMNCSFLRDAIIPEGVVLIGKAAFAQCWRLDDVSFPASLEEIGYACFEACASLGGVRFPENCQLTEIPPLCFRGCGFKEICLPKGITTISGFAFDSCKELERISLPDSVKKISDTAFLNTDKLAELIASDGWKAAHQYEITRLMQLPDSDSQAPDNEEYEDDSFLFGSYLDGDIVPISALRERKGKGVVTIEGTVFEQKFYSRSKKDILLELKVTDYNDSVVVLLFQERDNDGAALYDGDAFKNLLCSGSHVMISGQAEHDDIIKAEAIRLLEPLEREETAPVWDRRSELNLHTRFLMDALTDPEQLILRAAKWKHRAVAITDFMSVQAFPEAEKFGKRYDMKVIYGLEALVSGAAGGDARHITLLAKNRNGVKNLYEILSEADGMITESLLDEHRDGLLAGASFDGDVSAAVAGGRTAGKALAELAEKSW